MGDKVTIIDTAEKKSRIESFFKSFSISFDVIASRLGPVSKDRNIYQAIKDLETSVITGLAAVAAEIAKLQTPVPPPAQQFHFEGGGFMRTYKGDRPAETIVFRKPQVVDREGTPVDPQPALSYTFSSDKPGITDVSATDDGGPTVDVNVTYGLPVKLDDGSYDIAEVRAESNTIDTPSGQLKDVVTEQIQLVPGDAAGFGSGGSFEFPAA